MIVRNISELRPAELETRVLDLAHKGAAELVRAKMQERPRENAMNRFTFLRLGILPAKQAGRSPGKPRSPRAGPIPTISELFNFAARQHSPGAMLFLESRPSLDFRTGTVTWRPR